MVAGDTDEVGDSAPNVGEVRGEEVFLGRGNARVTIPRRFTLAIRCTIYMLNGA